MKTFLVAAVALLTACLPGSAPGAEGMPSAALELARAEWGAAAPCAVPDVLRVSFDEFEELCHHVAAQSGSGASNLALGCTRFDLAERPVAIVPAVASSRWTVVYYSDDEILAHEIVHAWLDCRDGSPDEGHHQGVWRGDRVMSQLLPQ